MAKSCESLRVCVSAMRTFWLAQTLKLLFIFRQLQPLPQANVVTLHVHRSQAESRMLPPSHLALYFASDGHAVSAELLPQERLCLYAAS